MNLTTPLQSRVLPTDFLTARLQGRRPHLFRDWETLVRSNDPRAYLDEATKRYVEEFGDEGSWVFMHHEYDWVYGRMNQKLRTIFQPYFLYFDLCAMLRCLRHRDQADPKSLPWPCPAEESVSLAFRQLLQSDLARTPLFIKLETVLVSQAKEFSGIAKVYYTQKGLPVFEREILNRFFAFGTGRSVHAILAEFFVSLAAIYNTLTLSKMARWSEEEGADLYPPGLVADPDSGRLKPPGDPATLLADANLLGKPDDPHFAAALETRLLTYLTKQLRRENRTGAAIPFILFYLWEVYLYGRNLGAILHGRPIEKDKLLAALVQ